ncbi:MAG: hypothetical protein NTW93_04330 [Phycisphaerae bacterium]|nr:hypothetical protein [Phycisphaerae bacterium]
MFNIFEYPFVGIGLAVVSMFALWVFGAVRPDKKRKWHFAVPFVIAALAFAIAYFVQTDKEKVLGAVNKGIKAFEKQKIEPIKEITADNYTDIANTSKEMLIAYCQGLFQTAAVEKITLFSRRIEIDGDKATFMMEGLLKFTEQSEMAKMGKPFLIVKARLHFKKTPQKKWLINSSEILELDRKPVNWGQLHN